MWYLLVVFIFTFLLMPLIWWFKGATGNKMLRRLGDLLALPGAIVLFVVPTFVLRYITDSGALGGGFALGGWRPVQYLWFLLAGYVIVSHARLQRRIVQARWVCLMVAVLLVMLSLAQPMGPDGYRIIAVWPGLFAMLGFAMKYLTFSNRFLAYSNEAVLPFYILHQNVLLWVGFFVVGWAIPDLVKYLIIMLTSFVTCVLLYEYVIHRTNVLRVLFGMKPLRREKTTARVALSAAKS